MTPIAVRIDGTGLDHPGGIQVYGSRIHIYVIRFLCGSLAAVARYRLCLRGSRCGLCACWVRSLQFLLLSLPAHLLCCSGRFRYVIRSIRRRKALKKAWINRIVIIGLDGLDPGLAEQWIDEGYLPNLGRLAKNGGFETVAYHLSFDLPGGMVFIHDGCRSFAAQYL